MDEKLRVKIANLDILPLLISSLDDDVIKVQEAAGGVLANLALSHCNHNIMVEAGVIPKLVRIYVLFAEWGWLFSNYVTEQFSSYMIKWYVKYNNLLLLTYYAMVIIFLKQSALFVSYDL